MPTQDPFSAFDHTVSASSTSTLATECNHAATNEEGHLHHPPTPMASEPPAPQSPLDLLPPQRRTLPRLIPAIKRHAGTFVAVVSCTIGLAAVFEDPTSLLQSSELCNGLFGLICAGGIIVGVVALDSVAAAVDERAERMWGKVWRWCGDRVQRGEGRGLSPLQSQAHAHSTHSSGLLGPSPMPRRRADAGWQHFTGNGFHRHEQKLRAVGQWSNMGRRDRTFDEILKEVEEMDEQDRDAP